MMYERRGDKIMQVNSYKSTRGAEMELEVSGYAMYNLKCRINICSGTRRVGTRAHGDAC